VRRVGVVIRGFAFEAENVHQRQSFGAGVYYPNGVELAFFGPVAYVVVGALAGIYATGVVNEGGMAGGFRQRQVGNFVLWHIESYYKKTAFLIQFYPQISRK
jgi:hypothetical protein